MEENKTERDTAEPRVSAKASKASVSLFPSMPPTIILLILPLSDSTTPVQQLVLFITCHYLYGLLSLSLVYGGTQSNKVTHTLFI